MPPLRPTICVLISLYNGEKFIAEQIDSIARQSGVTIKIRARDDGSTDNSAAEFEAACKLHSLAYELTRGPNIGAWRSFMQLIESTPRDCDAYAFSDQDDVWHTEKCLRAVRTLAGVRGPSLTFCGRAVTNENLDELVHIPAVERLDFGNALVQNVIQGAASTINTDGLKLIQAIGAPRTMMMHDWWMYLVFSAIGQIFPDRAPGLFYRQHDANLVGQTPGRFSHHVKNMRLHFDPKREQRSAQVAELLRLAGDRVPGRWAKLLEMAAASRHSFLARVRFASSKAIWRQGHDMPLWRALILLGRY